MATGIVTFVEQMFWTIVWVFIALILGWMIIQWVRNNQSGNALGSFADWVGNHADPQ